MADANTFPALTAALRDVWAIDAGSFGLVFTDTDCGQDRAEITGTRAQFQALYLDWHARYLAASRGDKCSLNHALQNIRDCAWSNGGMIVSDRFLNAKRWARLGYAPECFVA